MADIVLEGGAVDVNSVLLDSEPKEQPAAMRTSCSTGISPQNVSFQYSDERPESKVLGDRTPSPCPSQPLSPQSSIRRSLTPLPLQSPRLSPGLSLRHTISRSPTPFPLQNPSRVQPAGGPHPEDVADQPAVPIAFMHPSPTRTSVTGSMTSPAADSPPVSAQQSIIRPSLSSVVKSAQPLNRRQKKGRVQNQVLTQPVNISLPSDTLPSTIPAKRQLKTGGRNGDILTKKARTDSTPTKVNTPAWFRQSKGLFLSESLGSEWLQLVGAWGRFEEQEGYKEQGKLPSKGRPDVVQLWISRARSTTWRPLINDTKAYRLAFNAWWAQLQPAWRISGDGTVDSQLLDGNWDCLRRPGLNGLQSIVAALFFWGISDQKGGARKSWLSAVIKCLAVFSCLNKS